MKERSGEKTSIDPPPEISGKRPLVLVQWVPAAPDLIAN
jgi:hypothetical protein